MGTESQDFGGQSSADPLLPTVISDESFTGDLPSSSATLVVVLSTLVAVSGSYVFGSAIGFSSPAQTAIMDDLGLSLAEYSVFGSIMTIGAMLGAIMSGKLADIFGRRGAMGLSEMFCLLGWAGILLSTGPWWLDCGRLLIGYGVGVLSYVVPVYIAEITPKNLRGAFTTVNQFMISCGLSVMYLVGNFISWRILTILGIVPCVLHLLGLLLIPESPRWLAKIGRGKDSESALQHLRGKNADISAEAAEISDYIETLQQLSDTTFFDLFQRKYAHSLIVGVGLMVLQQLGGVNGITYYASAIFISAGFSSTFGTIGMVIVQVPMTLLGVLLMDKSGRRPLLMISAAGTCLGCFFVGLSFLLQDLQLWKEISPILALFGVLKYGNSESSSTTIASYLFLPSIHTSSRLLPPAARLLPPAALSLLISPPSISAICFRLRLRRSLISSICFDELGPAGATSIK